MRVDKLTKVDRLPRRSVGDFSCDCRCSRTVDTDGAVGRWARGNQARVARDRKELANGTSRHRKHVPAETLITVLQTALTLTKRAENVERLVIWQVCVDPLELLSPRPRAVRKAKEGARVRMLPRLVGTVVRLNTFGGRIHHYESGEQQPGHNHGWIGRKVLRCWQRE